jgi:hypothetical protein
MVRAGWPSSGAFDQFHAVRLRPRLQRCRLCIEFCGKSPETRREFPIAADRKLPAPTSLVTKQRDFCRHASRNRRRAAPFLQVAVNQRNICCGTTWDGGARVAAVIEDTLTYFSLSNQEQSGGMLAL